MSDTEGTVLAFGGRTNPNSGHAGSETSRARATSEDATGVTGGRQNQAIHHLGDAGHRGLTWREFASETGLHHGQATSALSNLHKAGRIDRLAEVRNRCKVYVLPMFRAERETEPYGQTVIHARVDQAALVIAALIEAHPCGHSPYFASECPGCDARAWLKWHESTRGGE